MPIKVYILCASPTILARTIPRYARFPWAKPILMKYQDVTFENAFWKQMLELYNEWKDCELVGTMSAFAHLKLRLDHVDRFLKRIASTRIASTRIASTRITYYHFLDKRRPVQSDGHPNLMRIYHDVLRQLQLRPTSSAHCNYFVCSPEKMVGFIHWFHERLLPAVLAHPLAMTNAHYRGKLKPAQLLALCKVPYYPHVPFVLERMNKCFFDSA
jgi:hypothetical protein